VNSYEGRPIVTQPPKANDPENLKPGPRDHPLRDQLLRDMSDGECLSLSHIDSVVSYGNSTEPPAARQSRVIAAIESLLTDGLMVVGEIVGGSDEHVDPWKLPTENALARLRELYVTHYDDWDKWGWVVWFALTPDGERVAAPLKGDTS
jgi:hypothetical protein